METKGKRVEKGCCEVTWINTDSSQPVLLARISIYNANLKVLQVMGCDECGSEFKGIEFQVVMNTKWAKRGQ